MGRIRTIKPEFFIDEDVAALSPLARLLFIGIWTLADREGRLEDRPRRIKVQVLPYDDVDIEVLLGELTEHGFILRYGAAGQRVIQIRSFARHQRPNAREAPSELPPPPASADADSARACTCTHVQGGAHTCTHVHARGEREGEREQRREQERGKGRGCGGREGESLAAAGTPAADSGRAAAPPSPPGIQIPVKGGGTWTPPAELLERLRREYPEVDPEAIAGEMARKLRAGARVLYTARRMPRALAAWVAAAASRESKRRRADPAAEREPRWGYSLEDYERFHDDPAWEAYLDHCSEKYGWEAEQGPWPPFQEWRLAHERLGAGG